MLTIDEAVKRERLADELHGLQYVNIAQLPNETYEQNLERRARLKMRESEILTALYSW